MSTYRLSAIAILLFNFAVLNSANAALGVDEVVVLHPISPFTFTLAEDVSGSRQVGWADIELGANRRAIMWNGTAEDFINLHPSGFVMSFAQGIFANSQVGGGIPGTSGVRQHALLWNGSAKSVVDLHPTGFNHSGATDVYDGVQVGFGVPDGSDRRHALLWHGTADSVVDLHPSGFTETFASSAFGDYQAGSGNGPATGGDLHALLWQGSAEGVVDLHPAGFAESSVSGIFGSIQGGFGRISHGGPPRALLWHGTAESVIPLHPSGFNESSLADVAAGIQVGGGSGPTTSGQGHALAWQGSAESVLDLHSPLLQAGIPFTFSTATGVDDQGNVVGFATGPNNTTYAVRWHLIPEPSSCCLIAWALIIAISRRRRLS